MVPSASRGKRDIDGLRVAGGVLGGDSSGVCCRGTKRAKADGGLVEKTLAYLATCSDVWAERRNSGSKIVSDGEKHWRIWLGEPGTPDICGQLRTGCWPIYFGIECKAPKGAVRVSQQRFHAKAGVWGMPILVARNLTDVQDFVAWLRGKARSR